MGFMRGFSRWLLAIIITFSLAAWIVICVLLSTVFNASVVKGWVASSGLYEKLLPLTVVVESGNAAASKEDLQKALETTITPNYLQQKGEKVIDSTYDWIHGKTQKIDFTIDLTEKRAEYSANLQKILEAKYAGLPACPGVIPPPAAQLSCIPKGLSATTLAQQASQIAQNSSFLRETYTPTTLNSQFINVPNIPSLPQTVNTLRTLALTLPFIILLCAGLFIFASDSKLRGLGSIGLRIFWPSVIFTATGMLFWFLSSHADLTFFKDVDPTQLALMNPLFQKLLADMGIALVLYAGCAAIVGAITWLTSYIIRRRQAQTTPPPYQPPTSLPPTQQPPHQL